jgi:hypothetical protein
MPVAGAAHREDRKAGYDQDDAAAARRCSVPLYHCGDYPQVSPMNLLLEISSRRRRQTTYGLVGKRLLLVYAQPSGAATKRIGKNRSRPIIVVIGCGSCVRTMEYRRR